MKKKYTKKIDKTKNNKDLVFVLFDSMEKLGLSQEARIKTTALMLQQVLESDRHCIYRKTCLRFVRQVIDERNKNENNAPLK